MWLPLLALIVGISTLVWSADKFLSGSASTASNLGVSRMIIGLTVVSVGTSAPEILVALVAALEGDPLLAVGNAIGSNIANIGLVLGVTAIVAPLPFSEEVRRSGLPWCLGATFLALFVMFDLELGQLDGLLLLGALAAGICMLVFSEPSSHSELAGIIRNELDEIPQMGTWRSAFWMIAGLIILVISAEVVVWGAAEIAARLGVSDLLIGLTVVAVGTSLPELAATLGSAIKGYTDIAIGNVVGSNILNILAVLAVPSLMAPTEVEAVALWRDCGTMLALTLLLALFAYAIHSRQVITRFEGAVMLLFWIGYNTLLVQQVVG